MTYTRDPFVGNGDMARRMRALDWSQTSLGDVSTWPQNLRSAVGICVESRLPIAIYWGMDATLLYNDTWSPILGAKHPWALGRPAVDVWSEIWDEIGPVFDQVFSTGDATDAEDATLVIRRRGSTEESCFNCTFSPIRDERGRVKGVFSAVLETTYRVIRSTRLDLVSFLSQVPAVVNVLSGPDLVFRVCPSVGSKGIRRATAPGTDRARCVPRISRSAVRRHAAARIPNR